MSGQDNIIIIIILSGLGKFIAPLEAIQTLYKCYIIFPFNP